MEGEREAVFCRKKGFFYSLLSTHGFCWSLTDGNNKQLRNTVIPSENKHFIYDIISNEKQSVGPIEEFKALSFSIKTFCLVESVLLKERGATADIATLSIQLIPQ